MPPDVDIRLEEITPAHFPVTLGWLADPRLRRELVVRQPAWTPDEQAAWYARYRRDDRRLILVACDAADGRPVGQVGFNRIDPDHGHGQMHIFVGRTSDRCRGYGRAIMGRFLDLSFGPLALNKVWLLVNADNARAIAFYRNLGFHQEGRLVRHERYASCWLDKLIFSRFGGDGI